MKTLTVIALLSTMTLTNLNGASAGKLASAFTAYSFENKINLESNLEKLQNEYKGAAIFESEEDVDADYVAWYKSADEEETDIDEADDMENDEADAKEEQVDDVSQQEKHDKQDRRYGEKRFSSEDNCKYDDIGGAECIGKRMLKNGESFWGYASSEIVIDDPEALYYENEVNESEDIDEDEQSIAEQEAQETQDTQNTDCTDELPEDIENEINPQIGVENCHMEMLK